MLRVFQHSIWCDFRRDFDLDGPGSSAITASRQQTKPAGNVCAQEQEQSRSGQVSAESGSISSRALEDISECQLVVCENWPFFVETWPVFYFENSSRNEKSPLNAPLLVVAVRIRSKKPTCLKRSGRFYRETLRPKTGWRCWAKYLPPSRNDRKHREHRENSTFPFQSFLLENVSNSLSEQGGNQGWSRVRATARARA